MHRVEKGCNFAADTQKNNPMEEKMLTNRLNDYTVKVHATTDHPASHYGKAVWVDDENNAYCQVGHEAPFYKLTDL